MKVMKLKIPPLFALSSALSFGQNVEVDIDLPPAEILGTIVAADPAPEVIEEATQKPIHDIDVTNYPLEKLLEDLCGKQAQPFNFVFKNEAEKLVIPKLKLKSVTDEAFFEVLENTLEVRVHRIDNASGADVIVISGPKQSNAMKSGLVGLPQVSQLFNSGHNQDAQPTPTRPVPGTNFISKGEARSFVPSNRSKEKNTYPYYREVQNYDYSRAKSGELLVNPSFRLVSPKPNSSSQLTQGASGPIRTQIFGTADLETDREVILDLIHTVWEVSDPDWQKKKTAKILFHPKTGILIVKGSGDRIGEVESVLETLRNQQAVMAEKSIEVEIEEAIEIRKPQSNSTDGFSSGGGRGSNTKRGR